MGALVVTNDVSARQIQLTKTQFYEAKSYPTFTPVGPWLTLVDAEDLARLDALRLTLSVNGEVRQDSTVADMIDDPAAALPCCPGSSRWRPVTCCSPAPRRYRPQARRRKPAEKLAGLLPPATKWALFFRRQAVNPRYLHDGDVVTAAIASPRRAARPRYAAQHRAREDDMTTPNPADAGLDLRAADGRGPHLSRQRGHPVDAEPCRLHGVRSWTYAALAARVTRIANVLTGLGVRRTDAVTLCGVNTSRLYAATLAAQAAGIAAPVNPALSEEKSSG